MAKTTKQYRNHQQGLSSMDAAAQVPKAVAPPAAKPAFGGGPKNLSNLPPGLQKYWAAKRAGK